MARNLKFAEAINEGLDQLLESDPSVYITGLGVPDPKGIFGTTLGLQKKFGDTRVMDMPLAENGMTGIAIGSALTGMRPILVHQRIDFAILSMEQIVNQAAKWSYMFGGQSSVPILIRLIIGRGWGQGPQHSQSLQSWFAHIPGLKVVMPASPADAKGLLIGGVQDNNPVIFLEYRWLHNIYGEVAEEAYATPIGKARIAREGTDVTLIGVSYMVLECLRAADALAEKGISAEVIDLRSLRPLDTETIIKSARKTGNVIMVDSSWIPFGISAEVSAVITENAFDALKNPPVRLGLSDNPVPTTPALAKYCYPLANDVLQAAGKLLNIPADKLGTIEPDPDVPQDIPNKAFTGPF